MGSIKYRLRGIGALRSMGRGMGSIKYRLRSIGALRSMGWGRGVGGFRWLFVDCFRFCLH